jgi:hypothetical protein
MVLKLKYAPTHLSHLATSIHVAFQGADLGDNERPEISEMACQLLAGECSQTVKVKFG